MQVEEFQQTILSYYHENGRVFPWRNTHDPYKILCSELMLQQTQTERVVPKYQKWIEHFPTAETLAKAQFQDVLTLWNGLGYNRRARFLQNACKTVVEDLHGKFPHSAKELQKLSGVGPYTSRAVSAFAFGNPEVFIETNIRALYLFFFFPNVENVLDVQLLPLIEQTLYRENPRTWYYALMDYGAELKRKVKNPNRKSAHYAKQSKFEGSIRQARGAILHYLTNLSNPDESKVSLQTIAKSKAIDYERIKKAALKLEKEGFIVAEDEMIYLDNSIK